MAPQSNHAQDHIIHTTINWWAISDLDHKLNGIHVWKESFPWHHDKARVVDGEDVIRYGRWSRQHLHVVTPEQSKSLTRTDRHTVYHNTPANSLPQQTRTQQSTTTHWHTVYTTLRHTVYHHTPAQSTITHRHTVYTTLRHTVYHNTPAQSTITLRHTVYHNTPAQFLLLLYTNTIIRC